VGSDFLLIGDVQHVKYLIEMRNKWQSQSLNYIQDLWLWYYEKIGESIDTFKRHLERKKYIITYKKLK